MIEIKLMENIDATIRVPGSKSYTQRAMIIAALAEGDSRLRDILLSEDTLLLAEALRGLGAKIRLEKEEMVVTGTGGRIAAPPHKIRLGNNGTAMRLLAGVASLGRDPIVLTGDTRLCQRPMKPLLDALVSLGADVRTEDGRGYPRSRSGAAALRGGGSSSGTSAAASTSLRS